MVIPASAMVIGQVSLPRFRTVSASAGSRIVRSMRACVSRAVNCAGPPMRIS
jgi:hypothetical protein